MNLWQLLFVAVLGLFIMHFASYFAIQMEKEHSIPEDPLYFILVTVALFGMFLSAFAFIKIVGEVNESKLKQADI